METKTILLLGSGLMAQTVVDYLLKRPENKIIVASNVLKDAQTLAQDKPNCTAVEVDVTDPNSLAPLVKQSNIVVSYVPWTFHLHVAKVCLQEKKHMVTASYIQPNMLALDNEVKQAGLTFLNEVGVDPGIDHIATMKVVDESAAKGDKILEYESFCGGLPSPEFVDNPLGYKFSWSPIGALLSLKNDAIFLKDGRPFHCKSDDLLYSAEKKEINMALSLEGYPNRDSVKYKDLYRLNDCEKLVRGTLRFYGFSMIMNSMKELNLLDKEAKVPISGTWIDLLKHQTQNILTPNGAVIKVIRQGEYPKHIASLGAKILTKTFSNQNYSKITDNEVEKRAKIILDAYISLKFFEPTSKVDTNKTFIENLVALLEKSCSLGKGETDMIVMQHKFKILKKNGSINNKKSTLVVIGQKNSFSAMAITVGTPTAIGTQLILDGVIKDKGVLMPNKKSIYLPLLEQLEKLGLSCTESDDNPDALRPKL